MKTVFSLLIAALVAAVVAPATSFAAAKQSITTAPVTTIDRDKPRVPGGSGCDDPDDIIEHPECR
jgi:hypothetical protein